MFVTAPPRPLGSCFLSLSGPTLDAYWSSIMTRLRTVRELPVGSGVLTFESGLPLDPTYSSVYIRACYGPLFEELTTSNYKNLIS